jgi:hypothetical protein
VRCALVLVSVLTAGLLAMPMSAGATPGTGVPSTLHVHFQSRGFSVGVTGGSRGGTADISIGRGGQFAFYLVKPQRRRSTSIEAEFGGLGLLELSFRGTPRVRCHRPTMTKGVYTGNFEFTGEHDYIHFHIHHARGDIVTGRGSCAKRGRAASRRPRSVFDREATDVEDEGEGSSMLLQAETPGPLPADVLQAIGSGHADGTFDGLVSGYRVERRADMIVERGAEVSIGPARFSWNLKEATATLRPAAPFSGVANFRHPAGGRPRLTGSLRVPILGGSPISLTGKRFRALFGPEKKVFYRQDVEAGIGPLQLR